VVIDGSDLGDLLPAAGVPFRWGWEARECWREPSAPTASRLRWETWFRRQPVMRGKGHPPSPERGSISPCIPTCCNRKKIVHPDLTFFFWTSSHDGVLSVVIGIFPTISMIPITGTTYGSGKSRHAPCGLHTMGARVETAMANDPLQNLRLQMLNDVLPVGLGAVARLRSARAGELFNDLARGQDGVANLRQDGEEDARQLRDFLDQLSPGLGNPVVEVDVEVQQSRCDDPAGSGEDIQELQERLALMAERVAQLKAALPAAGTGS